VLGLAECGSHAIIDAALGPYSTGEQDFAEEILRSLHPGMLMLADRGFFSYTHWDKAHATGADLLWRVKSNAVFPGRSVTQMGLSRRTSIRAPRLGATTPTESRCG
jgi:hypothetical protein